MWASVSLRLLGDNLPLEEVSTLLDLAPYTIGLKGDHARGDPRYGKHETNLWLWSATEMHMVPLESQLAMALDVLEPRVDRLRTLIRETGARAELFLGFGSGNGQGGAQFSAALLERLAKLGLPLQFDVYPL